MSDRAVPEETKNQTREYTDLLHKFNTLLKVHTEAVDKCALIESKRYDLRKDNAELRKMLKECQKDCKMTQENLDGAQREIERLSEQWELVVKRDLG